MRRRPGRRSKVPASLAHMDLDRVKRALFKHEGNVSKAARTLRVNSLDLRRLCWARHELVALALEHAHRMVDRAESKLLEALDGDHPERSLRASLFILSHSSAARERGWGRFSNFARSFYDADLHPPPTVIVRWEGDMPPGYRPPLPAVPEERARQELAAASLSPSPAAPEDERVHRSSLEDLLTHPSAGEGKNE
jgi:hypothetical protein